MTQAQLTPHYFENITDDKDTSHFNTLDTLTPDNLKDYLVNHNTCPQWEMPYLYSVAEHYLEIQLDILSAVISIS